MTVVKKTRLIPNVEIDVIFALKSSHEVLEAASYSRGGKKTRKTTSGSKARSGNTGTNPMINPTKTNRTGYGSFSLSISADKLIKTASMNIITLKFSILQNDITNLSADYPAVSLIIRHVISNSMLCNLSLITRIPGLSVNDIT